MYVKLYILKRPVVCKMSRDSSVGIATVHELDGQEIDSRWGEFFRTPPDRSWGPLKLLYSGHRVSSPGVSGRGVALNTPPSSAEVKERVELYLYSPCRPSWPVKG